MPPCEFEVGGIEGFITNTNISEERWNYSKNFNVNIDCTWKITVAPEWYVSIPRLFPCSSRTRKKCCFRNIIIISIKSPHKSLKRYTAGNYSF